MIPIHGYSPKLAELLYFDFIGEWRIRHIYHDRVIIIMYYVQGGPAKVRPTYIFADVTLFW